MSQLERKSYHLLLRASANPRTPYSAAAHWWHMRSREVAEAEVQAAEADTQIQIDICIYLLRQHIRHHASVERCFGRRLLTPTRGTLVAHGESRRGGVGGRVQAAHHASVERDVAELVSRLFDKFDVPPSAPSWHRTRCR